VQIKQFSGATIDEVLTQVRAELGDEAVILQTKRVVKGGIGGFFGREGVEVTAAEGLPPGESESANREAAASVAAPPAPTTIDVRDDESEEPDEEFVPAAFRRHLESRLAAADQAEADAAPAAPGAPASPAATYARAGAPFAPGDLERTQAILEAARAAVREAHAKAVATPPAIDELMAAPATRALVDPVAADEMDEAEEADAFGAAEPGDRHLEPVTRAATPLDGVRGELIRAGVDARYLDPFLDGFSRSVVPFLAPGESLRDAVKEHLASRLPMARDWKPRSMGHTIAFVGQSGVGKTSAAVGLAGRYRAAGLAVALIAAGSGAHDALEGHARRLDIQLFRAPDGASLENLCSTLGDRDLIVIDTEGRSHQHLAEIEELAALLTPVKADEIHLVLPMATPVADLGDAQRRFRMVGVNRLTMTKLDETRYHGNLVNVPLRMGKPLGFLSDGASVAGSLRPADARRVAEMLLP
jgi:flagellar biosynthesis protein FlhF